MNIKYSLGLIGVLVALSSCEIDNFEEPNAFLTGRIVYQGEPILVGQNEVNFELYQSGFGKDGPINVLVAPDGTFSSRLFAGNYRLAIVDGQGPFRKLQDSIAITLPDSGKAIDVEVTPYYLVRNAQFSKNGNAINATAQIEKILTGDQGTDVEKVTLFLNKTLIVSNNGDRNIAQGDADLSDLSNISVSVEIPEIQPTQNYVFARIGVKMANVEDWIFSPVEKIEF